MEETEARQGKGVPRGSWQGGAELASEEVSESSPSCLTFPEDEARAGKDGLRELCPGSASAHVHSAQPPGRVWGRRLPGALMPCAEGSLGAPRFTWP